ncbi:MAG: branched-chain amino acid transferase [Alphaproteobacteria bacterium]|nr:branched-chain amino acid transferase [Alphaproteobacteria bacterium]
MNTTNPFAQGCAFIDGGFVPAGEARIPVLDYGFLRSDATYDVVHVWNGAFFRLEDHLDRFLRNVGRLRMTLPMDRAALRTTAIACIEKSGLREAYVWMICTRGRPAPGSRDPRRCENRLIVMAVPYVPYADDEQRRRGLNVVIAKTVRRIPPESVDPTIKNLHWLDLEMALFEAYDRGAENAVLLDASDHVTEGPGFNVFCVENGVVLTPDRGGLDGITRRTTIELCAELGIPCRVEPIAKDRFLAADEIFFTTSAGGVLPVTRIEGRILGNGAPGPVTARLGERYHAWHREGRHATPVRY